MERPFGFGVLIRPELAISRKRDREGFLATETVNMLAWSGGVEHIANNDRVRYQISYLGDETLRPDLASNSVLLSSTSSLHGVPRDPKSASSRAYQGHDDVRMLVWQVLPHPLASNIIRTQGALKQCRHLVQP